MPELKNLVRDNKESILAMGSAYAEYFILDIEQSQSYCPANDLDAREYFDLFTDSRDQVMEAVYQQHRSTEAYMDRFLDYHRPTKAIKAVVLQLQARGYAVGYADCMLFITLETSFGCVVVMVACDSWIAESIEYDRASDTWQNVQDFMFDPTRTLTDYRSSDGIPSL